MWRLGQCVGPRIVRWSSPAPRTIREHNPDAAGGVLPKPGSHVLSFAAGREPPFSLTPGASARVELALEAAFHRDDVAVKELRTSVEACVVELQGKGMLPEAMVITMRAFLRYTSAHPPIGHPMTARGAEFFIGQIIAWSIIAYFPGVIPPLRTRSTPPGAVS